MINNIYLKSGYLLDPHTAVGMKVYEQYAVETRDDRATIVVSTASPFKFAASVLRAFPDVKISGQTDEFALLRKLSKNRVGQFILLYWIYMKNQYYMLVWPLKRKLNKNCLIFWELLFPEEVPKGKGRFFLAPLIEIKGLTKKNIV